MDWTMLVGALALVTLVGWIVLAQISKRQVEMRMKNDNAPKSTLAKDKASDGRPADV